MKSSKKLIIIVFATIVLAACQKDEPRVNFNLRVADQYTGGNGKVYIDNESNKPRFYEDEAVRINGETYLIDYRSGSPAVYDVAQSGAYYAIYPSSWVNGIASATPSITFPDMQEYRMEDGHQVIENPMVAYSTSGSTLNFYNVAALVTVKITNSYGSPLKVKYVSLYSDNTPLSGTATIDGITTPTPSVRITKGITNVSIDCNDLLIPSCSTQYVTFAVPPIDNIPLYVDVYLTDNAGNTKYSYTRNTYEHNPEDSASNLNKKTIHRSEIGVIPVDLHQGSGLGDTKECGYFWGSGSSEADPFIIMNKDDLGLLRTLVAKNNSTINSAYNNSGVYYLQTAHIDLSDSTGWTGIGTGANPFKANYDGSETSVTLGIGNVGSSMPNAGDGVGLFGTVSGGGYVKNLTTKGSIAKQGSKNLVVGAISGKVAGAFTFENCHNQTVLNTTDKSSDFTSSPVGGIIGRIDASGSNVKIKDCTNSATITRNTYNHIGGICGEVKAGTVTFEADINKGFISGTGTGSYFTGGICGACSTATNEFKQCVNEGDITSESQNTGGIVGYSKGFIRADTLSNTGSVMGTTAVGGIVGNAAGTTASTLNSVTNSGNITGTNNVGGIIGVITDKADRTIISSTNSGSVHGALYVGGIVGSFGVNSCRLTLRGCKNILNSSSSNDISGSSYVGGIYGAGRCVTIINCANYTPVSGTIQYIGGIVGALNNNIGTSYIDTCLNIGAVSSSRTGSNESQCGGIIGHIQPSATGSTLYIRNCVNRRNVSAPNADKGINGGLIGLINYTSGGVTVNLNNCYSEGIISGKTYTSGLVGKCNSGTLTVNNCYFNGTVSCGNATYGYALGWGTATWTNCYAVYGTAAKPYSGTTAGLASGTITNCALFKASYGNFTTNGTDNTTVTYSSGSYSTLGDALRAWQGANSDYHIAWKTDDIPTLDNPLFQ